MYSMKKKHCNLLSFQKEAFQLFQGQQVFYSTPLSTFDKEKLLLSTPFGKPCWIFLQTHENMQSTSSAVRLKIHMRSEDCLGRPGYYFKVLPGYFLQIKLRLLILVLYKSVRFLCLLKMESDIQDALEDLG